MSRSGRVVLALVLAAALAAAWSIGRRLLAAEIAHGHSDITGLERAIGWDASNAELHLRIGRLQRDSGHLEAAIRHTEKATELSPYDWRAHWQLAQLQEISGRPDQAEQAMLRAVDRSPNDPLYQWRLANFYLRTGRDPEFWEPVSRAIAADPSLLRPAFSLMIKMGAPGDRVDSAWPPGRDQGLQLIGLLSRLEGQVLASRYLPMLLSRWRRVLESDDPPSLLEGGVFIDGLLKAHSFDEARRQWIALARANALDDRSFAEGRNQLWNGSFELPLTGVGLGWRVRETEGVTVEPVVARGQSGNNALAVAFAGTRNLNFAGLEQRIVVQPGATYRFSFTALTEDLTTDQGPYLEITDPTHRLQVLSIEEFLGTSPWREHAFTFAVAADTSMLLIRLRRSPSRRIDNRIGGTLLLDGLSLEALETDQAPS